MPIVAGTGASSTRESIQLCKDAADAGADYVMVIPPGYYAGPLMSNPKAIKKFFVDISNASPVPVYVYAQSRWDFIDNDTPKHSIQLPGRVRRDRHGQRLDRRHRQSLAKHLWNKANVSDLSRTKSLVYF